MPPSGLLAHDANPANVTASVRVGSAGDLATRRLPCSGAVVSLACQCAGTILKCAVIS